MSYPLTPGLHLLQGNNFLKYLFNFIKIILNVTNFMNWKT